MGGVFLIVVFVVIIIFILFCALLSNDDIVRVRIREINFFFYFFFSPLLLSLFFFFSLDTMFVCGAVWQYHVIGMIAISLLPKVIGQAIRGRELQKCHVEAEGSK